jgi:hypothetical protein
MGTELRKLKPETITRALVALRAELIREGGPGLEHVEALLQLRGHNLGPVPQKAKTPARFRRNRLRVAIYAALRDGPLTGPEIVRRVSEAHGIGYAAVYRSVYTQLGEMRRAGRVVREDGRWRLAEQFPGKARLSDHGSQGFRMNVSISGS